LLAETHEIPLRELTSLGTLPAFQVEPASVE
jgi:hypothetical protein